MCLGGLFVLPAAGMSGRMLVLRYIDRDPGMAFAVLVAMPGIYWLMKALRKRIVLFRDRVELHGALRSRVLLRSEIEGRRLKTYSIKHKSYHIIYLVPRQADKPAIELIDTGDYYNTDPQFDQWVRSLPDLGPL
jgi:hypothetical protein